MNHWVAPADRLPDEDTEVLVTVERAGERLVLPRRMVLEEGVDVWLDAAGERHPRPIAWRSFPAPYAPPVWEESSLWDDYEEDVAVLALPSWWTHARPMGRSACDIPVSCVKAVVAWRLRADEYHLKLRTNDGQHDLRLAVIDVGRNVSDRSDELDEKAKAEAYRMLQAFASAWGG